MKTAVVYYSMSGNTEFVAKQMAEEIPADLVRLAPVKEYPSKGVRKFLWGGKSAIMSEAPTLLPYDFDVTAYDRIVFGTPVWAGTFAPPLRTFIRDYKDELAGKSLAAFACCAGGDAKKTFPKLKEALGVDSLEQELVLTDPKDNRKRSDDNAIRVFCSKLG
ncbi:MAG: flavodoxin [Coriobacteriales bacterium]|nr:flavodoxin [Coriobacteriales bacterium]